MWLDFDDFLYDYHVQGDGLFLMCRLRWRVNTLKVEYERKPHIPEEFTHQNIKESLHYIS